MDLKTFNAVILVASGIISIQSASANGSEDSDSLVGWARSIHEKFEQLFDRLDRLELNMNRIIIGQEGFQCGETGSRRDFQDSPAGPSGIPVVAGSNKSQNDTNFKELNPMPGNLSQNASCYLNSGKLEEAEIKLEGKQRTLEALKAYFIVPPSQRRRALMSNSVVTAALNKSATFFCESEDGQPWTVCVWEQNKSEIQRRSVVIDQDGSQNGGQKGISFVGDALSNNGKCGLRIDSVTKQDFDQWSCTLASVNGTISTGTLHLRHDLESSIYFVTARTGVSVYSLQTMEPKRIVNSHEDLLGIAHDSINKKLYWSNHDGRIYRANTNGSNVEIVLNTKQYGNFWGLAFDWIGRNIYGITCGGYILACSAASTPTMSCFTILDGQFGAVGIALNPVEGTMYWTRYSAGSLHKAGMDGSSSSTIITGLDFPVGLTIDFASRRLYWAEWGSNKIRASDFDGLSLGTAVELPRDSTPHGIALLSDRIYWGNFGNDKLQSSARDGWDIQTLYTDTNDIRHIVLVPAWNQPTNRKNHCEGQKCSKLCVLTPTSYRCLA